MRPSNICYMNEFPLDGVFANDNSGKPLLPAKSSLRVPLAGLVDRVRSVLDKIATQRMRSDYSATHPQQALCGV